jgi:hypothetical protein
MKTFIGIASVICAVVFLQSCLSCTECKRDQLLKARCVKPNDTLTFDQDMVPYGAIQRWYPGGDSFFYGGTGRFETTVQLFTDSGYICSVTSTPQADKLKSCNRAGEGDDIAYQEFRGRLAARGYTCRDYKGQQ